MVPRDGGVLAVAVDYVAKEPLAEFGDGQLGPSPLPQRQRRITPQRHALQFAVYPGLVVAGHAPGRKHLDDHAAFVGAAVALGLGFMGADSGIGKQPRRAFMST